MTKAYSLTLLDSPLDGGTAQLLDLTHLVRGWRRSIRSIGGPWIGTFRIEHDEYLMNKFFNEYLFLTVRERFDGATTWKGTVWEMTYTHRGVARTRSMNDIKNAVKVLYTDNTGTAQDTGWATQDESIARYGRIEHIEVKNNYPAAAATNLRDKILAVEAWPWARPAGGGGTSESYLDVTVAGMIFTANNKFVTATAATTGNIDVWVTNIVTDDCQFFTAGDIDTNTIQVQRTLTMPTRAFDQLEELAQFGSASLVPWRVYTDEAPDGTDLMHYQAVDTSPLYYLSYNQLFTEGSRQEPVAPWAARPGVVRDLEYPVRQKEESSWLGQAGDLYIEEVMASERGLSWGAELFDESATLAALLDYRYAKGSPETDINYNLSRGLSEDE